MTPKEQLGANSNQVGLEARIRAVGARLGRALGALLETLPGAPHRPSQLARDLGVNRAVASRVLSATKKTDALETLHLIPGPEPLRKLVRAALQLGASAELGQAALTAIDSFDQLIREEAGTRPALDALISSKLPGARERIELSSKYSVFKGLSQLKGVQAETWLGCAIIQPSAEDEAKHDLTWLNGAVAMQRLRPGVTARFSYRHKTVESANRAQEGSSGGLGVFPLDEFCGNPPAQLRTRTVGETVHYTLPDDLLGPQEVVDMFVVDHHPAAIERFSRGEQPRLTSLFVEPAMPVASLVFDVLLHEEVFRGSTPELLVYDTGYEGLVDANDRSRDLDRVPVQESIEFLGRDIRKLRLDEIPTYRPMLLRLAERFGWDPGAFRGYRTRISYPVYGWQVCLAFERPLRGSK